MASAKLGSDEGIDQFEQQLIFQFNQSIPQLERLGGLENANTLVRCMVAGWLRFAENGKPPSVDPSL